jgi:phage repressor protein C with HTH and peptisase S24 domain
MFSDIPKEDLTREVFSKGIPLISRNVLSLNNSKFLPDIVHERYAIPDFILRIKGDSMAPLLKPGYLVACEIVSELKNNHIHAISTKSMGIIIKYVSQENMPDHLTFTSENKSYPPFNLPPSDIVDLALVTCIVWPLDSQVNK